MRWHDRFIRWFAAANGSKRCFYGTILALGSYVVVGQRIPGLPHLTTFDPYPYVFCTFALSLWANAQNIALQFTGQEISDRAREIQEAQEAHLAHLELLVGTLTGER